MPAVVPSGHLTSLQCWNDLKMALLVSSKSRLIVPFFCIANETHDVGHHSFAPFVGQPFSSVGHFSPRHVDERQNAAASGASDASASTREDAAIMWRIAICRPPSFLPNRPCLSSSPDRSR